METCGVVKKIFNVDVGDLNLHQLAVQNSILVISITPKKYNNITQVRLKVSALRLHTVGSVMYGKVMAKLEVLYNSECPICDKEIKHYEKISSGKILYTPISPASLGSWGISEGQAAEKLHARLDGKTMVGVDAFLEIWSRLPYYRVLSRIVKIPPIKFVANIVYSKFLAPILFGLHRSRQKRVSKNDA